jgi:hypothetical protein
MPDLLLSESLTTRLDCLTLKGCVIMAIDRLLAVLSLFPLLFLVQYVVCIISCVGFSGRAKINEGLGFLFGLLFGPLGLLYVCALAGNNRPITVTAPPVVLPKMKIVKKQQPTNTGN